MNLKGIDKSIIDYFDKTPEGIVCPHFYELKWANGCMYSCIWCYLQGTFRYTNYKKHGSHPNPIVKERARVEKALRTFLDRAKEKPKEKYLLNSGELSDSLITTGDYTLPELIASIEDWPKNVKVLYLSKTNLWPELHIKEHKERIITSWSINAYEVAHAWEKGAPPVIERIVAASSWHKNGYKLRFRIDPIVPVKFWQHKYFQLIDELFSIFNPKDIDSITLGTLRGLQSTITAAEDTSWTKYLDMDNKTQWGYKMPEDKRIEVYSEIMMYLLDEYGYKEIAVCKETTEIIEKIADSADYIRNQSCNCVW